MPTSEGAITEFGSSKPNLILQDSTKSIESALVSFQQALTGVYSALGGTNQDETMANQISTVCPGPVFTEETVNVTLARPRPPSACEKVVLKIRNPLGKDGTTEDNVVFDGAFQVKLPKARKTELRPLSEEMEKTARLLLSCSDDEIPLKSWRSRDKWLAIGLIIFIFTFVMFLTAFVLWLVL